MNPNGEEKFPDDDIMSSRQYGDIIKRQRNKKVFIAKTLKYLLYVICILILFFVGRWALRKRMIIGNENNSENKSEKIY